MSKSLLHGMILLFLLAGCRASPSVQPTDAPPPSPTSTSTAVLLLTPTGLPVAYVGGSVPCFAGPQVDENIVATIEITDAPVLRGMDESGKFWAIQLAGANCWVEAAYVTASYDPGKLDTVMPTPTPKPPKPPAPQNARAKYKCFMLGRPPRHVDASLSWEETPGAEGYRIYREGKLLAELDASETQFMDTMESRLFGSASGFAVYTIESYNSSGYTTVDVPIRWFCNQ